MPTRTEIEHLILKHQRRLQKLKEKRATLGINTPPEVLTEIEDIEAEIAQLQIELSQSHPAITGDLPPAMTGSPPNAFSGGWIKAGIVVIVLAGFGLGVFMVLRPPHIPPTPNLAAITSDTPTAAVTQPITPSTSPSPPFNTDTPVPTPTFSATNTATATPLPPTPTATEIPLPSPSFTPTFTPMPQVGSIIDDFENYSNSSLTNDFIVNRNAGNDGTVVLVGAPHVHQGRQALAFEYDIRNSSPNHYIGFDREFLPQDWSSYASLCLWLEGDGSNRSLVIQFGESKFKFWKNIASLAAIGVGEHCVPIQADHQLDLRLIGYYGVYIEGPPQGPGLIYLDDVVLKN